jgi:hypothetical protein
VRLRRPQPPPAIDAHNALALAEHLGVEPDRADRPDLAGPLLHGRCSRRATGSPATEHGRMRAFSSSSGSARNPSG